MTDQMPREVALALLTSGQSMPGSFRRTCLRATERIVEPVSRSTTLNISAPKTPRQRFERKLSKSNAKQLNTWLRRATRRGERLQDRRDIIGLSELELDKAVAVFDRQIAEIDTISQAITSELTSRQSRIKL